jgi:chloramphenicol-sensitive protein RarD
MKTTETANGIAMSVTASAFFALLTAYVLLLQPLDGLDIFAWRIFWTVPAAFILLIGFGRVKQFFAAVLSLIKQPVNALLFVASTSMLGLQMWVFLWAPINGYTLDMSLGYFLLPVALVIVGRYYYQEKLGPFQKIAVLFALIGIAHELWATHAFSWVTLLIALGYPPYFILRRRIKYDQLIIFCMEILLMLPAALILLYSRESFQTIAHRSDMFLYLLPGLGIISMIAFYLFLKASYTLPMSLFGILSYFEPVFIVLIAITFLGETLTVNQLYTYIPIWISVGFTIMHSIHLVKHSSK